MTIFERFLNIQAHRISALKAQGNRIFIFTQKPSSGAVCVYHSVSKIMAITALLCGTVLSVPAGAGEALPIKYNRYDYQTGQDLIKTATMTARQAVENSRPGGKNLFNKDRAKYGYAISAINGSVYPAANMYITGLLPVSPGDHFVSTYGTNALCWYDINGKFIAGSTAFTRYGRKPIAVPANAWFVQFQGTPVSRAGSLMVTSGQAVPQGYIPFTGAGKALPLQNKKVIWLGDSITYNRLYQPYVLAGTGMVTLANYAKPGQSVRKMADSINKKTLADADVISIFGGTNDYGGNRRLGTLADARIDYDESKGKSFYYDVFYVLKKISTLKPSAKIVFSTPLKRGATAGQRYTWPEPNGQGVRLEEYVQAIKEVSAMFSVPVCDLFNLSGINSDNLDIYTGDNLHPNDAGSALHARPMIAVFNGS